MQLATNIHKTEGKRVQHPRSSTTSGGMRLSTAGHVSVVNRTSYVLAYLRDNWPSFDVTGRLIARYVLENPEEVIYLPFAKMLRNTGACSAAISRFCRDLGFKGYAAFKIALARELGQISPDTRGGSWLGTVFESHRRNLMKVSHLNSSVIVRRASKAISRANRIELFATEAFFSTAYLTCCHFKLLGLPASAGLTSYEQLMAAEQLRSGDIAFGISFEAVSETVRCLELAHQRGATVIWLSSVLDPQVCEYADIIFCATSINAEPIKASFAPLLAQWAIIDTLLVALAYEMTGACSTLRTE